jgi:hypothetical protein
MKSSALSKLRQYISSLEQWYLTTPERALDEAYTAALKIKQIEDEHFAGNPIADGFGHSRTVMAYFQTELQRNLKTARMRLTEFRASNRFIDNSQTKVNPTTRKIKAVNNAQASSPPLTIDANAYPPQFVNGAGQSTLNLLEKIKFVDAIIARYQRQSIINLPLAPRREGQFFQTKDRETNSKEGLNSGHKGESKSDDIPNPVFKLDSSSFIPRSILITAGRFRKELDPAEETEAEVVKDFRASKIRTRIAISFLLQLILIPLLTQQISKAVIIGPLVDHLGIGGQIEQRINVDIEDRILKELNQFEERLKFQHLIQEAPILSIDQIQSQLREKAMELAKEYKWELNEPLKNILADGLSLATFAILLLTGKTQLSMLKSLMDEMLYGLSDSAKAFIIILFTDVFVGFHSPHGWTVIVENTLQHFGLPLNQDFIDMFIATFPVMLDTVFKYWIFRYLNQVSPSAVATYKNMNE